MRRPVQGDRAGRGGVRPLRQPRASRGGTWNNSRTPWCAPSREPTDAPIPRDGFAEEIAVMSAASARTGTSRSCTPTGSSSSSGASRRSRRSATLPIALAARVAGPGRRRRARGPPRDPVGLRLGSEPREPHRAGTGSARDSPRWPTDAADSGACARWRVEWPFFATLLENAELSLAKADPAIADLLPRPRRPPRPQRHDPRGDAADHRAGPVRDGARPRRWTPSPTCSAPSSSGTPTSTPCRSSRCGSWANGPGVRTERLVQATISGVAAGLQNTG